MKTKEVKLKRRVSADDVARILEDLEAAFVREPYAWKVEMNL